MSFCFAHVWRDKRDSVGSRSYSPFPLPPPTGTEREKLFLSIPCTVSPFPILFCECCLFAKDTVHCVSTTPDSKIRESLSWFSNFLHFDLGKRGSRAGKETREGLFSLLFADDDLRRFMGQQGSSASFEIEIGMRASKWERAPILRNVIIWAVNLNLFWLISFTIVS